MIGKITIQRAGANKKRFRVREFGGNAAPEMLNASQIVGTYVNAIKNIAAGCKLFGVDHIYAFDHTDPSKKPVKIIVFRDATYRVASKSDGFVKPESIEEG